jgi:IstB-like ATP binding protein
MVPCGLPESETTLRENRGIEHRLKNARLPVRFPVIKTLEKSRWSWPRRINRSQIQNLFRLAFIATHTDVVLIGAAARRISRSRWATPPALSL